VAIVNEETGEIYLIVDAIAERVAGLFISDIYRELRTTLGRNPDKAEVVYEYHRRRAKIS